MDVTLCHAILLCVDCCVGLCVVLSLCRVDCRVEYLKLVECSPPQHLVECNHPGCPAHVNTCLNEVSIYMCLELGEELFKSIIHGGKISFLRILVSGSTVRKKLESTLCRDVKNLKNIF